MVDEPQLQIAFFLVKAIYSNQDKRMTWFWQKTVEQQVPHNYYHMLIWTDLAELSGNYKSGQSFIYETVA